VAFSTFFGGSAGEGIRDVEVDSRGNVYVAGTTRSPDFPTTPGAYDVQVDTSLGKTRWGYNSEIFVAKFSPAGDLVWSTLIGGPHSEEAYGLEIDGKGYVVVHGRGAPGSPITPGVYQEQFKGCGGGDPGNPHNTTQNAYIGKLAPDGSSLVWASFFGIDHLHRDLDLDENDDIYVTWGVRPGENDPAHRDTWMKPAWNANAFQPDPLGGDDCGVAKIAADGSRVLWATYLGGSDYDSIEASICVDDSGYVYVGCQTRSIDIPTTPGAHDRTHNGGVDWYVARLLPDGSDIVYGTYIGDAGDNWLNTHNLAVDSEGNSYSSTCAFSSYFPTTPNAIQRTFGGGKVDWGIVKLSPTGALLAGTLLGGSGLDNPDGIRVDAAGNLVLFGQSGSADFPVTDDAYQATKGAQDDAVLVKLSPNFDRIVYGTFLGGDGNDAGRAGCAGRNGSMIVAGATSGGNWPTKNAFQNVRKGPGDAMVALLDQFAFAQEETMPASEAIIREIEAAVDHSHCTTRQFQHKTFHHEGIWFVFYSDGRDFRYQTSEDGGRTWQRAGEPVAPAPNGSTSFDLLIKGDEIYVSHAFYPLGRYDVNAPYAKEPARREEYRHEGRVKKGRIEGRTIRWLADVDPGFTPDYSNLVQDAFGYFWVFTRESQQGVAYRSRRPNDIGEWGPKTVCIPESGRHALDAAALDEGRLYTVSMLTTDGRLYGNLYDGREWGSKGVLLADDVTRVAGDDRRLALEFDPTRNRLHLVYVDAQNKLRYRFLDAPYRPEDWRPRVSESGLEIAAGVFTCALSVDTSRAPYGLVITYGLEKHLGGDKRERTGELHARRFEGEEWQGQAVLVSQPDTIHNWYPNVNQDVSHGLCVMYSRSVDEAHIGAPLAVMVCVCPFDE